MTKPAIAQLRAFRHSGFGFLSSFVIRHSIRWTGVVLGLALLLLLCFSGSAFVVEVNSSGNPLRWRLDPPDPDVHTNVVNLVSKAVRYFLAADGYSTTNTAAPTPANSSLKAPPCTRSDILSD